MSLTSRIQDQKDHITQVKKMIKYSQKRDTRIDTIKKNPYLLSQANRDKKPDP